MNGFEIDQFFRMLQLETEEQRSAMRFEPIINEDSLSIQVITTDSTSCQTALPESQKIA